MMRALLEGGADPKLPSANQTSPLMVAAGLGQTDSRMPPQNRMLEAVRFALELDGNVNGANAAGQTAVHGAASVSADAIIQFLFERGAKVDVKDRQGRTPCNISPEHAPSPARDGGAASPPGSGTGRHRPLTRRRSSQDEAAPRGSCRLRDASSASAAIRGLLRGPEMSALPGRLRFPS